MSTVDAYAWRLYDTVPMETIGVGKAIVLGVVQGLTEFLPVSSSGHLVVAQQWLGLTLPAETLAAFDVALHAGTLLAVMLYYWRDLWSMVTGRAWPMVLMLCIGTLPAAAIGIPLKDQLEALFASVTVVGVAWLFTGVFLWLTHYCRPEHVAQLRLPRAVVIGVAQAMAMIPGVSRSGATIATGMFLRIPPAEAARFSFLLAMPAIGGSLLFEVGHLAETGHDLLSAIIAGVISSAIVGYVAIRWLLHMIAKGQLRWFGLYCGLAGIVVLIGHR